MSKRMQLKRKVAVTTPTTTTTTSSSSSNKRSRSSFTYWNQEFYLQERVAYRESVDQPWMSATIVNILYDDDVVTLNIYQQDSQYFNINIQSSVPLLASMQFFEWQNGKLIPSTHNFKPQQVWEVQGQGNCIVDSIDQNSVTLRNGDRIIILRGNDILDKMQRLISSPDGVVIAPEEEEEEEKKEEKTMESVMREELWFWYTYYYELGSLVALKDKDGDWYEGRIINLNQTVGAVQVHYEGFPKTSDEWVRGWDRVSVFYNEHFEPLRTKKAQPGDLQVKIRYRKFYKGLSSVMNWFEFFDKCSRCQKFEHSGYFQDVNNDVFCDDCKAKYICSKPNCSELADKDKLCKQHADECSAVEQEQQEEEKSESSDDVEMIEQAEEELNQLVVHEQQKKCCSSCGQLRDCEFFLKDGEWVCSLCHERGLCVQTICFNFCAPGGYCFDHANCVICNKKGVAYYYKGKCYCSTCHFQIDKRDLSDRKLTITETALIKPNPTTTTSSSQPTPVDLEYSNLCSRCLTHRYVKAYTAETVYWSLCHPCYVAAIRKKVPFLKVIYEEKEPDEMETATDILMQFKEPPEIKDGIRVNDLVRRSFVFRVREVNNNHALCENIETHILSTFFIDPLVECNHINIDSYVKETITQSRTEIVNFMLSLHSDLFMICWSKRLDFTELMKKSNSLPEPFMELAREAHESRTVIARLWPRKTDAPMKFGHTLVEYIWDVDEHVQVEQDSVGPRMINNEGIKWIIHNGIKHVAR